jgi:hypothetical protein
MSEHHIDGCGCLPRLPYYAAKGDHLIASRYKLLGY